MSTLTSQDPFEGILAKPFSTFDSQRKLALESYQKQGLPSLKSEEYKFTAISKKISQSISNIELAKPYPLSKEDVSKSVFKGFEGYVLVFSNGIYQDELSDKIKGVSVDLISKQENTEIGSIAKVEKDPFCALNTATFQDGIFIHVPDKMIVDQPILLLNFVKANDGQVIQPRIWVEAGDFAEVTFIERFINSGPENYFCNEVTEIKGGKNTHIRFYLLQNEGDNAIHVTNTETDIKEDSSFTALTISLSGEMLRNNLSLNILGSNSEGNMYGLYLLDGTTHVDNHTNVDHTVPHAESNELYKGVLKDKSRGVFNGKIFVRQDAQKTNAFQQNNNILLSDDAIINTKPQLEIWADDVKCSHGCTTGQLDEEALFYLQARGIGKAQAKALLLYAFTGEVLEHIKDESFKSYCIDLVQEKLGTNF